MCSAINMYYIDHDDKYCIPVSNFNVYDNDNKYTIPVNKFNKYHIDIDHDNKYPITINDFNMYHLNNDINIDSYNYKKYHVPSTKLTCTKYFIGADNDVGHDLNLRKSSRTLWISNYSQSTNQKRFYTHIHDVTLAKQGNFLKNRSRHETLTHYIYKYKKSYILDLNFVSYFLAVSDFF